MEAIQPAATVAHHHLQLGEALEDVAVAEELGGQVLLGVEAELIVVGHDAEASIQRIGAVHDDRDAPLLAFRVQRVPVRLVHTRRGASASRIGAGVGGDETQVLDAPLELTEHVRGIRRMAQLGQLRRADEAVREVLALDVDAVVDEAAPVRNEVLLHEAHRAERPRSDDLDVDVALVHVVDVPLGCLLEVLRRQTRCRATTRLQRVRKGSVGRHHHHQVVAGRLWRGHVTVNIEHFYAVVHIALSLF